MLRLSGIVILPQPVGPPDQNGMMNNRILALWPYTHIMDPDWLYVMISSLSMLPRAHFLLRSAIKTLTAGWLIG